MAKNLCFFLTSQPFTERRKEGGLGGRNDGSRKAQKALRKRKRSGESLGEPCDPQIDSCNSRMRRPFLQRAVTANRWSLLTGRGEPSSSACDDLGHKWRAVESPSDVTVGTSYVTSYDRCGRENRKRGKSWLGRRAIFYFLFFYF